ncbi:hypothetical protein [Paenibacillus dendritiformis]|uniref:hypothetical protein n=1 Tax=Paenibacillus dendritiformis TaxID=130049 RepID=UPI00387E0904
MKELLENHIYCYLLDEEEVGEEYLLLSNWGSDENTLYLTLFKVQNVNTFLNELLATLDDYFGGAYDIKYHDDRIDFISEKKTLNLANWSDAIIHCV